MRILFKFLDCWQYLWYLAQI